MSELTDKLRSLTVKHDTYSDPVSAYRPMYVYSLLLHESFESKNHKLS